MIITNKEPTPEIEGLALLYHSIDKLTRVARQTACCQSCDLVFGRDLKRG